MDNKIIESYILAGFHVIPLQKDKSPIYGWKWRDRRLSIGDLHRNLHGFEAVGIAMTDGMEGVDIDLKYDAIGNLFESYCERIESLSPGLIDKLFVQKTMHNGYHFLYKCSKVEGNKKLARRPSTDHELLENPDDKIKVLIETRGIGGYIAIAPSPGYSIIQGKLSELKEITPEERDCLFITAVEFDTIPVTDSRVDNYVKKHSGEWEGGENPFEAYNQHGDPVELLLSFGWEKTGQNGPNVLLKRPGTENKVSATFHEAKRVFYVFSSSTVFDQNRGYTPASVYAKLLHGDDFSATAKDLISLGFGKAGRPVAQGESDPMAAGKKEDPLLYISPLSADLDEIEQWRRGDIPMGKSTGFPVLDRYFLHKPGSVVIVNGISGAGKTIFILFLYVVAAINFDWTFVIYSSENKIRSLRIKVMQFYLGIRLQTMTQQEYKNALEWIDTHFKFIKIDALYTSFHILDIFASVHAKYSFDAALIDPYNSLTLPNSSKGGGAYIHHQETAGAFRVFTQQTKASLWVNMHPYTGSVRRKDSFGFIAPPQPEDTENGGMWWNRCDDFLTIHRIAKHPTEWMYTKVFTRKIKEFETGGMLTGDDDPVLFKLEPGGCVYTEVEKEVENKNVYDLSAGRDIRNWVDVDLDKDTDIPF